MKYKLSDICSYFKEKVDVSRLTERNYISTENMLPDKNGVTTATSLPTTAQTQGYREKDVLVSNIRPYFKKIWFADRSGGCSNDVLVFRANEGIDARYLYYVLADDTFFEYSMATSKGTKMPRGDKKALMEYEVPDYGLEDQQKIAGLLSALDDKIQLNTEINNNLEQQGLALYKSYFIDFDPYEGIQPKGWNAVSLEDVCLKITDGSHYSPKDDPGAPYPMYSVKDMETYGFNSSSCKHISADEFERMKKSDCVPLVNDILVAKDGSYLKEIFICSEQKDEAVLSSIAIFRPDPNVILPDILLFLLKQPSIRADVADNYVSGSALPRIVLKDFKKYQFILPPIDEQRKIGNILHSFRMQITTNVNENNQLNALRDALLPKLMSGETDVSDIDL